MPPAGSLLCPLSGQLLRYDTNGMKFRHVGRQKATALAVIARLGPPSAPRVAKQTNLRRRRPRGCCQNRPATWSRTYRGAPKTRFLRRAQNNHGGFDRPRLDAPGRKPPATLSSYPPTGKNCPHLNSARPADIRRERHHESRSTPRGADARSISMRYARACRQLEDDRAIGQFVIRRSSRIIQNQFAWHLTHDPRTLHHRTRNKVLATIGAEPPGLARPAMRRRTSAPTLAKSRPGADQPCAAARGRTALAMVSPNGPVFGATRCAALGPNSGITSSAKR